MRTHYVNGRVLLRDVGGVRRYAAEVAEHLPNAVVVKPRSAKRRWSGRVWEQTTLLARSADGVLLNMAHSGPARHQRQVNVIHDLFALRRPETFHPAYAALMRMQIPRLVRNAKALVAVSAAVAAEIASEFDVSLGSIAVVPPGISELFRPIDAAIARQQLHLALDRPVVAALIDPAPRKRSVLTVEVLRAIQAQRPDVQVVVAGRVQPPAHAKARRRPLPPSRTGFVDLEPAADERLAAMYQAADVFVSMSDTEGFGLPVVEAAAAGAAVVSTPVPSIAEHCRNGAVLVDSSDGAVTAALGLLDEPLRRAELVATAADELCDLRWDATAASLDAIMTDVATR